jgi:hypothetical protein
VIKKELAHMNPIHRGQVIYGAMRNEPIVSEILKQNQGDVICCKVRKSYTILRKDYLQDLEMD